MDYTAGWGRIITSGFSLAFGVWAAGKSHVGLFDAGSSVIGTAAFALTILIGLSAVALLAAWTYRFFHTRALPADAVFFVGSLLGAEILWRFVVDDLPDNSFKLVAVAAFFAQPLIATLGVAAVALALRRVRGGPVPTQPSI